MLLNHDQIIIMRMQIYVDKVIIRLFIMTLSYEYYEWTSMLYHL